MKDRNFKTSYQPARVRRATRLDCYEFYLWSTGEARSIANEEEDIWDYIEGKEKGGNIHGYQII